MSTLLLTFQKIMKITIIILIGLAVPRTKGQESQSPFQHPLDPLDGLEIKEVADIIRSTFKNQSFVYNEITLFEPHKADLLQYFLSDTQPPNELIPRRANAFLVEYGTNNVFEAVVNINSKEVESFTKVPAGNYPIFTPEDSDRATDIMRADPDVKKRVNELGWPDINLIVPDTTLIGYVGDKPEYIGKRILQMYLYGRNFENDNQYAHPFDFTVLIDYTKGKVIGMEDIPTHENFDTTNKEGNVVPRANGNYDPDYLPREFQRTSDRPIETSSPNGPSYTTKGFEISWQKFKLRVGFNPREGMVIYHVNYNDSGRVTPLIYRAALSEMFVPYGDPRPPFHRKAFFDAGQYGLGRDTTPLKLNVDCLGSVKFFDGYISTLNGNYVKRENAICVHEEGAGILWKHGNFRTKQSVLVRSKRLVITNFVTAGNYDYEFSWQFYQDASIRYNVQATGSLNVNMLAVNATHPKYGTVVADQIYAQNHQHFFAIRIDLDLDGVNNTVSTSDVVPLPEPTGSPKNPYGQGLTVNRTDLKTAGSARTFHSPSTSRVWIISNPNSKTESTKWTKMDPAWRLMPENSQRVLMKPDNPIYQNARFLDYDCWTTPYIEGQRYAGGTYLNGTTGLMEWVSSNENANIENTDIVVWYMFGLTHIPRVEDYPLMPTVAVGLFLKPYNFFNENPGLDVPPATGNKHLEL